MAQDQLSQEAVESLEAGRPGGRMSQDAVEVLASRPVDNAGLSQIAIEILMPARNETVDIVFLW